MEAVLAGVQGASLVLAEVNPRMPRTHGDAFLPVEEIDYFVRNDRSAEIRRRITGNRS